MLLESKSNLARLMATENILIEQRKVPTACFDVKNRILTIPVLDGNLSPELYDLLLGHEVGHALETPAAGWHDSIVDLKVNKTILNVCEDARIEKKIKRKFPGIRVSFVKGYKELLEKDFFGIKDTNLNDLNFIDRVNLYTKGGASQGIEFLEEEMPLLLEVENTESFEDVVKVAIKIQEFMKESLTKQSMSDKMYVSASDDSSEEYSEEYEFIDSDDSGNSLQETEKSTSTEDDGNTESQKAESGNAPEQGKKDESVKKPKVNTLGRQGGSGQNEESIESKTDKKFREKEKELHSKERYGRVYANIPKAHLDKIIYDYKELSELLKKHGFTTLQSHSVEMYNKYRKESSKVVSYLVKEFELRKNAEQQSRAKVSKTGELNLNKVHEFRFTDDIFARITNVPNGKSHGLVMFIDWSGSMIDHLSATVKQLLNLVWFCKKVNIPFEVYAFGSNVGGKNCLSAGYCFDQNPGDISLENFSLLNLLSSRMNSREFLEMACFLYEYSHSHGLLKGYLPDLFHLAGTPLNECVIASFQVIEQFKQKTKAQIVNTVFLTDGEGTVIHGYIDNINNKTGAPHTASFNYYYNRIVFRDPVTKSTCMMGKNAGFNLSNTSSSQTVALLSLLKERIGGNVIGFYIANYRDVRGTIENYSRENTQELLSDFRKNKYTFINKMAGYDEYYFLRSDKLDTEDDADFEVKNTTTRGLVSAFSKYTNNRVATRVILNRFIQLIS